MRPYKGDTMNIYVTTPAPVIEQPIELSKNGELIMLAIVGAAVVGFFGIAYKIMCDDPLRQMRPRKTHFWNR